MQCAGFICSSHVSHLHLLSGGCSAFRVVDISANTPQSTIFSGGMRLLTGVKDCWENVESWQEETLRGWEFSILGTCTFSIWLHFTQFNWDFQQHLGFENPPYPFRDSVFPFWWNATFCRFPSFKLQDKRVCFCQTCSFHILISVLGVGLFFAKSKERRYFHIEFQCPESSTNLIFINSFNGHKCSDLMP